MPAVGVQEVGVGGGQLLTVKATAAVRPPPPPPRHIPGMLFGGEASVWSLQGYIGQGREKPGRGKCQGVGWRQEHQPECRAAVQGCLCSVAIGGAVPCMLLQHIGEAQL